MTNDTQTPPRDTRWLSEAIRKGFLRLTALSLSFQPGPDVIAGTVRVWHDALLFRGVGDPRRDPSRIDAAFQHLAAHCRFWPAPEDLVAALPPIERPVFRALPRPELTEAERADRRAFLAIQAQRIAQLQRENRDDHGPQ